MKRFLLIILSLTFFMGCASIQENQKYTDLSKNHTFSYYFPGKSTTRTFSIIDEAYDFINTAKYKLTKSINLKWAKGLAARLYGPRVHDDKPVVVTYFINATDSNGLIDFSKRSKTLETISKNAVSVSNVFMVFYEERGVSISDFYIQDGYIYNSNSQYINFRFNGNVYKTDYPFGWGIKKAFKYIRPKID